MCVVESCAYMKASHVSTLSEKNSIFALIDYTTRSLSVENRQREWNEMKCDKSDERSCEWEEEADKLIWN